MKSWLKIAIVTILCIVGFTASVLTAASSRGFSKTVFSSPKLEWRANLIRLKIHGALPETTWTETMRRLGGIAKREALDGLQISNPYRRETDLAAGAKFYNSNCIDCHGPEGSGGNAAELLEVAGFNDDVLYQMISRGISSMPKFAGSEKDLWQVISYVRSFRRESLDDSAAKPTVEPKCEKCESIHVAYEDILKAGRQPQNWLTYSGSYDGQRYSQLDLIHDRNVSALVLKWVYQADNFTWDKHFEPDYRFQATPLVVNDVMYASLPPSDAIALDTQTGRPYWTYHRSLPDDLKLCCYKANRGLAILGDTLYLGTLDAHLVALSARTGAVIWDTTVDDYSRGFSITAAPLAVKDKIVVGMGGGDMGTRSFIDAYDAKTGKLVWRFYTIPEPGEPGGDTWKGEYWKTGGAATWLTGSYDPELNLIYWGTGNPAPVFNGDERPGDNLYANSVVAVDADTGKLKWYFQFLPHDTRDWDSNQIPVLLNATYQGRARKLMLWANRNGFYYALDRETGEFLRATPFARQNWAEELDAKTGRPKEAVSSSPTINGTLMYPGKLGATNWHSPSYSPLTNLFYVLFRDYGEIYYKVPTYRAQGMGSGKTKPIANDPGFGGVRALDPLTGEKKWEFQTPSKGESGILSTKGNLVFVGSNEGYLYGLDSRTGKELWKASTGARISSSAATYLSNGKQQVTIASGNSLFAFELLR